MSEKQASKLKSDPILALAACNQSAPSPTRATTTVEYDASIKVTAPIP